MDHKKGFTLVELIVTLGIMSAMAAVTITPMITYSKKQALEANTRMLVGALRDARSKTISSVGGMQHGVYITPKTFTFFDTGVYSSTSVSNKDYTLSAYIIASSTASSITFDRVTGNASPSAIITLSFASDPSVKRVIEVQGTGIVNLQ